MSESYVKLVNLAADGAMAARVDRGGVETEPIMRQDDLGRKQARLIAASVLDVLVREGVIDGSAWGEHR